VLLDGRIFTAKAVACRPSSEKIGMVFRNQTRSHKHFWKCCLRIACQRNQTESIIEERVELSVAGSTVEEYKIRWKIPRSNFQCHIPRLCLRAALALTFLCRLMVSCASPWPDVNCKWRAIIHWRTIHDHYWILHTANLAVSDKTPCFYLGLINIEDTHPSLPLQNIPKNFELRPGDLDNSDCIIVWS